MTRWSSLEEGCARAREGYILEVDAFKDKGVEGAEYGKGVPELDGKEGDGREFAVFVIAVVDS